MRDPDDAVLRLMAGEASAAELAAEQGVTVYEVESWRRLWLAGAKAAIGARRRRWRGLTVVAAVMGASLLALWGRVALAAGCTSTLPAPLVTLCANQPAVAADVNGNFQSVLNLVSTKIGAIASPDVAVNGNLSATGNATVNGNATVGGALNLGGYVKSCAVSPCYCNATNEVPVNWGATCNGAGVGFYSAVMMTDAGQHRGYEVKCIVSNFTSAQEALSLSLTCMRLTSS